MNYLIHTGPGLGDVIQFLSMARAIKEQDSDARIDFLIGVNAQKYELNMQIIACQDYVSNVYRYRSNEIMHDIKEAVHLQKNHYDYGFLRIEKANGKPTVRLYYIMKIAGCKKIIGAGVKKADIYVDVPEDSHYIKRNSLMLNAIGLKGVDSSVSINKRKIAMEWLNEAIQLEDEVIALSMGTNPIFYKERGRTFLHDVKSWSYQKWMQLAKLLAADGYKVVLMGGSKEASEIEKARVEIPENERILNMIGKTTINQSFAVLARSKLVVGAEGGMMHCASAVGTPTLTIFGGSDYRLWNPGGTDSPIVSLFLDCSPCLWSSKGAHCETHNCLEGISTELVYTKIMSLMKD